MTQIKMRSCWIRVGSNPVTVVLLKRGKFGGYHTHREHCVMMQTVLGYAAPRNAKGGWQPPEARREACRIPFHDLQKEPALLTP